MDSDWFLDVSIALLIAALALIVVMAGSILVIRQLREPASASLPSPQQCIPAHIYVGAGQGWSYVEAKLCGDNLHYEYPALGGEVR